jgi:epsilon-lactone hydrolase
MVASNDETIAGLSAGRIAIARVTVAELDLGGLRVYEVTPDDLEEGDQRVYLEIHGGAFIYGAGNACRAMSIGTATRLAARVWGVDYRMPPDHPFPTPLDDCIAAYRALLERRQPHEIIVGGSSAGGNLTAALLLRAHDEELPMPAGAVLSTPAVDLTESGDSYQTNLGLDPLLPGSSMPCFLLYAGGVELTHRYLSPLYGELSAFPPTILTTGTRDLLLSDTVRMHRALRAAGVAAQLHVEEAAGHGGFFGLAPEDEEIFREIRRFVEAQWTRHPTNSA